MRYTVLITKDQQGNMLATAPGLPDCHAQARTRPEVIHQIQDSIANIISRSEVIHIDVPAKPKSGNLDETPWEFFGAYPNDPDWGGFFEEIERQRASNRMKGELCQTPICTAYDQFLRNALSNYSKLAGQLT